MRIPTTTFTKLPNHVAIIMDGNGTWAKKRGLPRTMGHRQGAKTLLEVVKASQSIGIKYLTVFAFSTENWSRPQEEVDYLMKLPFEFLAQYQDDFQKSEIKFQAIGKIDDLPEPLQAKIKEVEQQSLNNTGLNLIVAVNYGGHEEIVHACNQLLKQNKNMITEADFVAQLYTNNIPDVDLLIRTSGQMRISNFLLWQIAYSEIYFTEVLWPDFHKKELIKALKAYESRDRRFGGIK
ncbi:MAG TPA: isoprenyl transferase [Bacilli bacterium]|nr:MAG: Isoprenyl transferase [Tenericutes bacterium ADurb.BinA124]HNZ50196.1 isoprenyl transferase [Bacilli bacterium]HOH17875.1 isoprenyl transferase [Bacilli bacterium]HPX83780.1 isoprenyl transferase [Bacilli bacterium]HQC73917.1 isoprenyl transferase [Bacilli bacterium]